MTSVRIVTKGKFQGALEENKQSLAVWVSIAGIYKYNALEGGRGRGGGRQGQGRNCSLVTGLEDLINLNGHLDEQINHKIIYQMDSIKVYYSYKFLCYENLSVSTSYSFLDPEKITKKKKNYF